MDQGLGVKVQPGPASGPNPTVAGILAGVFPIGVGAVYTGQYAKGLAHLVIMVLLILGVSSDLPWYVLMVLGIAIGFFYIYQIIDAVRSAEPYRWENLRLIPSGWRKPSVPAERSSRPQKFPWALLS